MWIYNCYQYIDFILLIVAPVLVTRSKPDYLLRLVSKGLYTNKRIIYQEKRRAYTAFPVMTDTIIDSFNEDDNPQQHFVQCESCSLFLITDHEYYLCLKTQCPGPSPGTIRFTCNSCQEKESLLLQIHDLNETVFGLNNTIDKLQQRVQSLTNIKDLEDDFNNSVNLLSNQFSAMTVNNGVSFPALGGIEEVTSDKTFISSTGTSVWTDSHLNDNNSDTDISDGTPQLSPQLSSPPVSNNNSNNYTEISDRTLHSSSRNQPPILPIIQTKTKMERIEDSNKKFEVNDVIKTLIIGDGTVENIDITSDCYSSNSCFKISRRYSHNIKELADTTEFFLDKLHKGVNQLVLQISSFNFFNTNSEEIKDDIKSLIKNMGQRKISLVISGPIPHNNTNMESFSRMIAINSWLDLIDFPKGVTFINNFDMFWKRHNLFASETNRLSASGYKCLTDKIKASLITLKN